MPPVNYRENQASYLVKVIDETNNRLRLFGLTFVLTNTELGGIADATGNFNLKIENKRGAAACVQCCEVINAIPEGG